MTKQTNQQRRIAHLTMQARGIDDKRTRERKFSRPRPAITPGRHKLIKAPSGGIPARAGNLMGKATCDVWDLGDTSYTISDTTKDIEVLNWGVGAACATGDRYGWAAYYDGAWWVISEDCADEGIAALMTLTAGEPTEGDGDTGLVDEGTSGTITIVNASTLDTDLIGYQHSSGGDPPEL